MQRELTFRESAFECCLGYIFTGTNRMKRCEEQHEDIRDFSRSCNRLLTVVFERNAHTLIAAVLIFATLIQQDFDVLLSLSSLLYETWNAYKLPLCAYVL